MPSESPTHKPSFRPSFRATPFPSFATGEPTRRNDDSGSSEGNQQQSDGNGWRNTGGIVAAGVFGTLATWFAKKFGFCKQAGSDKDRQEQDAQGFDDANDFQQHANGLGGHFGSTWD